ncbi:uncharacterized protein LOC126985410 isoform X2 [Eriocheir sinensis]|uniref:uncharacterized protein LOC126985410 isoform X2 n=1 Tax=Eriocheir sinensis TaxID=95602 RepID=UPI0021C60239|nr:uncharacterized protein LOC126985410 isoform X2 [Eriocheir sinensis]
MPQRCSVPGCYTTYQNTEKISFHTFPKDRQVRREWVRVCSSKITSLAVLDNLRICSLHFPPEAFQRKHGEKLTRLKAGAVPCLNLPPLQDAPGKLSHSNNVPFGFPDRVGRGEDRRHSIGPRRGLPGRLIAWDLAPSDTTTPEVSSASVTHLAPKNDKRPTSPEDSAVQVTFFSKNGINQDPEQSFNPTPSKTANSKFRHDVTQFDPQKNLRDPLDVSVKQGSKEKEIEVPKAVSRESFGIKAKYKAAKKHKVDDLHKDTHNPADQTTLDPSAISLQREKSKPIKKLKNVHSLEGLMPPDQSGMLDVLLTAQSNVAVNRKELSPNVKVLNYLPLLIPCQQSVANARTASTQGEAKDQPAPPVLPTKVVDVDVMVEEVEEVPMEDDTQDPLSLHPTTTTRIESANQSCRTEEPTNTNRAARDRSCSVTAGDSSNSSHDERDADGGQLRNGGTEKEGGGGDDNEEEEECGGDDDWQKAFQTDAVLPPPPFTATPGPRNVPHLQKPVDYVLLFITPAFTDTVARKTNKCADQWINKHKHSQDPHHQHAIHTWHRSGKTTAKEIYAFLAVTMNMSQILKPCVASYWDKTSRSQATPWFGEHFVLERYVMIMKFLSFADCDTAPSAYDPSYKLYDIQPLITHFNHVFGHYFKPHQTITLGANTVGSANIKLRSWHCTPAKPVECRVKIWNLCDVETGYTVAFEVESESFTEKIYEENEVYDLVMRLMEAGDVLHQGYLLHIGSCCVFPQLLFDLWKCQTLVTGRVRPQLKGLPHILAKGKWKSWQVFKQKKGPLFCIGSKDQDKNLELMLSSVASKDYVCSQRMAKGRERPLPRNVKDHRQATNSANFQTYFPECSSLKVSTRVAMSVINTAFLNAYLLYVTTTSDKPRLSEQSFMASAIEGFTEGYIPSQV